MPVRPSTSSSRPIIMGWFPETTSHSFWLDPPPVHHLSNFNQTSHAPVGRTSSQFRRSSGAILSFHMQTSPALFRARRPPILVGPLIITSLP
ncbi:hypothetical protein BDV12DRAFT_153555 [Aspergillus spectabilis]